MYEVKKYQYVFCIFLFKAIITINTILGYKCYYFRQGGGKWQGIGQNGHKIFIGDVIKQYNGLEKYIVEKNILRYRPLYL